MLDDAVTGDLATLLILIFGDKSLVSFNEVFGSSLPSRSNADFRFAETFVTPTKTERRPFYSIFSIKLSYF